MVIDYRKGISILNKYSNNIKNENCTRQSEWNCAGGCRECLLDELQKAYKEEQK